LHGVNAVRLQTIVDEGFRHPNLKGSVELILSIEFHRAAPPLNAQTLRASCRRQYVNYADFINVDDIVEIDRKEAISESVES
jgi:hypothetical protein